MKQPGKEKVEQYRKEFNELLKDLLPQSVFKVLRSIVKIVIGILKAFRIKFFYYYFFKFKTKFLDYNCRLYSEPEEIVELLKEEGLYHPVSDHNFLLINTKIKKPYLLKIELNRNVYYVPFLYYKESIFESAKIVLLINYINIPESVMLIAIKEIIKRFFVESIHTQRNYNEYKFSFLKKKKLKSFSILCDGSYEKYLLSIGKKTRFNMRYYFKKLKNDYPTIYFKVFKNGEFTFDLFLKFKKLVGQRYDERYWEALAKEEIFSKFTEHIIAFVCYIDGVEVAFNIFYTIDDTLIFIGNTFDLKFKDYSLGFITTSNSIKWACENGYKKIILGPGDFGYKNRLSNAEEVVYEYYL